MRATLQNLEKRERIILDGAVSMNQALYEIKKNELWTAVESEEIHNFSTYVQHRLGKALGPTVAYQYAALGQVEAEDSGLPELSNTAKTYGLVYIEGTKDLDVAKTRRVFKRAIAIADKAGESPTDRHVKAAKAEIVKGKPPKPLGEQLQGEIRKANNLLTAMQQLTELDEGIFADVEEQNPGVAKRLAKAFSDLASFLRKV